MAPKLSDQQAIVFVQENPKRSGTKAHERYEGYKAATTVDEALRFGAVRADISNDSKAGFCKVQGSEVAGTAFVADTAVLPPNGLVDITAGKKRPVPEAALGVSESRTAVALGEHCAPPAAKAMKVVLAPSQLLPQPPQPSVPPLPCPAVGTAGAGPISLEVAPAATAAAVSKLPKEEVDLSFAKLDGMPMKYVKRSMGEARRLLSHQGREEAKREGYEFQLADRDNLSKWVVKLHDLNPDGHLAKGLAKHKLEASIDLEITLPHGFPLEPPFARVVYPKLQGGYVFGHGGICFEPLTAKGWAPSMTLPSLAIAIKGIMDYGDVRVSGVGDKAARRIPEYSEEGARKDHKMIVSAHNGGDSKTYGSLKNYAS